MDQILESHNNVIMCGDLNFDLLSQRSDVADYVNMIESNSCFILNSLDGQDFTFPSHRSILDHFVTNMMDETYHIKNNPSIADHHACLLLIRGTTEPPRRPITTMKHNPRIISALQNYLSRISNATLVQVHNAMKEIVTQNTFNVTLLKKIKLPWIDNETLNAMEQRNRLYLETKDPLIDDNEKQQRMAVFKRQKNEVTSMLRRKRNEFIQNHIQSSLSNPRRMWQVMKMILRKSTSNQNDGIPKTIETDDGHELRDQKQILNSMNKHFLEIGHKMNEQMECMNGNRPRTPQFLRTNSSSLILHDTNVHELSTIIKSLKDDAACGLDGISAKNLKRVTLELSKALMKPINDAMTRGDFPESFKEARIKALYKGKGSRKKCTNYRPISVLSNLSKIYEKLLYLRFNKFLTDNNIIAPTQFGFLAQSCTTTAAIHAISRIQQSLNDKMLTAAVFIDLAKAFDSVDHGLLLEKLNRVGIRGPAHAIIQNYLFARHQKVVANDTESDRGCIRFGVPQGSNLSSLLFIVYVNDCLLVPLNGHLQMYADDTIVIYSCTDPQQLHSQIEDDMNKLNNWMYDNYLSFNTDKTNYMLFKTSRQANVNLRPILVNNSNIKRTNSTKYLGLIIDEELNWGPHVQSLRKQLFPYLFVLRNTKYNLPKSNKKALYYAYIHSHLNYLISIWGYAQTALLKQLQVIQNKAIRSIFWQEYHTEGINTEGLRRRYSIPDLEQLRLIDSMTMIYKIKNNLIKNDIQLVTFEDIHGYNTRNKSNFVIPKTRLNLLYNSIFAKGLSQFNVLPTEVRSADNLQTFKKLLKTLAIRHNLS